MAIEVGLFLPVGPSSDDITDYIPNVTAQLDSLNGQLDSPWMSDRFFWDSNPKLHRTHEQILEQLAPYIELGVDYFMFEVLDSDNPDVLSLLATDVIPQLKAMS